MPEISNNYFVSYQPRPIVKQVAPKQISVNEFYRRESRKNDGLAEKFYNWVKNTTGLGVGSKKVLAQIEKANKGEVSQEQILDTIHKYNSSQETSAQLLGDGASVLAAGGTFYAVNRILKNVNAIVRVNKPLTDQIASMIEKTKKEAAGNNKLMTANKRNYNNIIFDIYTKTFNYLTSNKKLAATSIGLAALAGGFAKYFTLKFNRIGSDEFKVDEQIYGRKKLRNNYGKAVAKIEKKRLNKERRNANFRNFASGVINGLMTPVFALGGLIAAPLYLVGNSLNRYFVANRTDKNKSLGGYIDNLKGDIITTGAVTAALAVPLVKKSNFTKVFNENIEKVTKKLADAKLNSPEFKGKTAYKELEELMLGSSNIKSIIESPAGVEDKITQLTKENIFAVKFKQIAAGKSELTTALREKCPPTRTIEEAQEFVNQNAGSGYELKKLLGVGTVAETYLAKDTSGKEVCIKILKDGISKDKILEDKKKFVDLINTMSDKSADEKDYLLRNLDDLAEGILKEVDLKNEMDAALRLEKNTLVANVVKPIDVKNNVYIMEKADGVSLSSFMDLNRLYIELDAVKKLDKDSPNYKKYLKQIEDEIERVKSRMPDFKDIKLNKKDSNYLLKEYQKVFIEQFHKVDKNGKAIHADIHPGNIFINPEVLKTRKGKLFTLIDTGNVIDMNVEQSMRALNLTNYVRQGNVKDIVKYVLDGAKTPGGMSMTEAENKLVDDLTKIFFDDKTKLKKLNDERILALTNQIMQKHGIIPGSSQLNLNKSRTSARNSLEELQNSIMAFDEIDILGHKTTTGKVISGSQKGLEHLARNKAYDNMVSKQERQNLKQLTPLQRAKQKRNPNAPKKNSEEYITYKLKQVMVGDIKLD